MWSYNFSLLAYVKCNLGKLFCELNEVNGNILIWDMIYEDKC